jgi:hypothetical protein
MARQLQWACGMNRLLGFALLFAACVTLTGAAQPPTNPDAATIADFKKRVAAYVALHKKLEATLPKLPKEANPTQIDEHERALGKLMLENRANARQGDLLTPPMQKIARRLLRQVFRSEGGAQLKKEILEEYTAPVTVKVNGRYPDTVPLSTVPPQILKGLPELPEELEYRFVGDRLILLDPRAHMIADYMEHVFP